MNPALSGLSARQLAVPTSRCRPLLCYSCRMTEVASRELRNHTRALLARVADGERVTITVRGRPVAELTQVAQRPRWMRRDRFTREILCHKADPGLADDLTLPAGETTDDLPWR